MLSVGGRAKVCAVSAEAAVVIERTKEDARHKQKLDDARIGKRTTPRLLHSTRRRSKRKRA